ncbi:MAG TPA: ABC transporter permease [Bryobacteraceae bacterium]|nr:ABC transporter permease [Bryobacteraceae bacterium]
MSAIWKRLLAFFRGARLDRDLDEEIAAHLAMQEEEFRQKGMTAAEARAAARREFGGVAQTAEIYRERRGLPWLETAAKDVRYALRGLGRNRGFSAAAVLSLALGIGANTAIFSMYHALLLQRLPVRHPEQLVTLYRTGGWGRGFSSYPLYREIRQRGDLFSAVLGRSSVDKLLFRAGRGDRFEKAQVEAVTGNYFLALGVSPAFGRLFTDDDDRTPKGHPFAVLSYDFWKRRFGGDPAVLGQAVTVDKDHLTVIGVAARGFRGVDVDHHPDLWEPASMEDVDFANASSNWLWILARRRPGVPVSKVQAAIDVLFQQHLAAIYGNQPNAAFRKTAMNQHIEVREGGAGLSGLRDGFAVPLTILMAAVGLVLLASCANVANLLLARGAARQKEIAVRLSLGATRMRLMRQALIESLLLALAGSAIGILLAWWGEQGLLQFLPASSGDPFDATPNLTVLAFAIAIAVFAAALFGLAPAWRSSAIHAAECLKSGGPSGARHHSAFRQVLVVAQVAFSVMLVALAGLFGHSLAALRSVDLGFYNQKLVAFSLEMPMSWKAGQTTAVREEFLARMQSLPGVSLVSFGAPGPFLGGWSQGALRVPGSEATAHEPAWVSKQEIAPRFFDILGSAPLLGREFTPSDTATAPQVAIVNQAFVRAFLPGDAHPLNRVLTFDNKTFVPIVGVVHDIPHQGLREKIAPTVYVPIAQSPTFFGAVLLRAGQSGESLLPAIRREVEKLGPDVSASDPKTIRQEIDESIFQDRLVATVGGFFGLLALLLAAIGLYGVMAYSAARRAREIGIRIAMGAKRGAVLWMVLRGSLLLVIAGLAIGVPVSLIAARKVAPVLFGIRADDSITFVSTAGVLLAVGLAAAFLPARRAASLEPMRVLRQE